MKPRLRLIPCVLVMMGTLSAIAQDSRTQKPESVSVSLQQISPHVKPRIVRNIYKVFVIYEGNINGRPLEVTLNNQEPGEWSEVKLHLGEWVKYVSEEDKQKPKDKKAKTDDAEMKRGLTDKETRTLPKPTGKAQYHFELRFKIPTEKLDQKVDKFLKDLRQQAEDIVKEREKTKAFTPDFRKRFLESTINKLIRDKIGSFENDPNKPPLHVLNPPRLLKRLDSADEEMLREYLEWWDADILFRKLPISIDAEQSDKEILTLRQEVLEVLSGKTRPDDRPYQVLKDKQIESLKRALAVRVEVEFTPHLSKDTPDQGWVDAVPVAVGKGNVSRVLWSGKFANAKTPKWLAIQSELKDEELEFKPVNDQAGIFWMLVDRNADWRYLRVLPSKNRPDFQMEITGPKANGSTVEIREPPSKKVTFPF